MVYEYMSTEYVHYVGFHYFFSLFPIKNSSKSDFIIFSHLKFEFMICLQFSNQNAFTSDLLLFTNHSLFLSIPPTDCLRAIAGDTPQKHSLIYILYLAHYPWFNQQSIRGEQQNVALWKRILEQWTRKDHYNASPSKKGAKASQSQMSQQEREDLEDEQKKVEKEVTSTLIDIIRNNQRLEGLIRDDLCEIKYPIAQRAIIDTMASVFQIEPTLITQNQKISKVIEVALNSSHAIIDFNEKEKAICDTPEGVLCTFDDEHHSRINYKKKKKKKKKTPTPDPKGGKKKKGKSAPKKKDVNDKLLVKKVREQGTRKQQTDEEWEAEQRRLIALKHGAAEREKQEAIEKQSKIRQKLASCRFKVDSIFRMFRALMMISRRDFAEHLAEKYLLHILPFGVSELLRETVINGIDTILQSLSGPIRVQSKNLAILMVEHQVLEEKFWEDNELKKRLQHTIYRLKRDSGVPDVDTSSNALKRKREVCDEVNLKILFFLIFIQVLSTENAFKFTI